ncbi:MAG: type II toxin-antitoxin system PemK/MazF family toxin [Caldilineaceae bacterium]
MTPPLDGIQPAELWLANIPFTDGSSAKKRPVLVLWLDGKDVIVAAVTSAGPRSATDVPLADWKTGGLRVPSTVRLARLDCLEQSLLLVKLGRISPKDAQKLQTIWRQLIQPQF